MEQGLLAKLKKILGLGGVRAPSKAQEILVGRGGVAGNMSTLKSESVVIGRVTLVWISPKVEIVGECGLIQTMMCKLHIKKYNDNLQSKYR